MKTSIKSLALLALSIGMLTACNTSNVSQSKPNSENVSSNESSSNSSQIIIPSSNTSSKSVVKTEIVVTADKTDVDVFEKVKLSSNVDGVTYSTTEGATIEGDVFTAQKEGFFVVTAHKDGDYKDGTITIEVVFKKSVSKIKNILNNLKTNQNYTLNFSTLLGNAKLYRTPTYVFNDQEEQGQALLDNNLTSISSSKVSHFIKVVNNKLVVGSAVVYVDTSTGKSEVATNLDEVDAFYDVDVDKLSFRTFDGKMYCSDRTIRYTIASMLNSISVMFGDELEFSFDENYNLAVRVMFYDPDTGEVDDEGTNAFGTLTFTNIGTTCAPIVDDALKNLTISNTKMSDSVASSFMSTKGHLKTTIKFVAGNSYANLGTSEYHFDEKYLKEDVISNSQVLHNFYEKDGEDACIVGVGHDNTLNKSATAYWSDFTFPYKTFNVNDFRQIGEHNYTYLGDNASFIADNLAWANIGEEKIAFINATESNGKVTSITCETRNKLYDIGTTSQSVYAYGKYVYEIEVIPYETLVPPSPYEADANTNTIRNYFNEFNKENANYTLTMTDGAATGSYKKIKVTPKTILVEQYLNSTQTTTYRGYHTLDDGTIEFSVINNGDDYRVKLEKDVDLNGKSLASLLGFDIAPEIMDVSNGSLVFKDRVLSGGEGLFKDLKYASYAFDDSVTFSVQNNKISSIYYKWYEADNAWENVAVSNYGTTALNSEFETELLNRLATIRTAGIIHSWQEESSSIYALLVGLVGEDKVNDIPYIYNDEYSGHFDNGTLNDKGTMVYIKLLNGLSFSTDYRVALRDACVGNGFTNTTGYTCKKTYENGYVMTVSTTSSYIGVIYKPAE